MSAPGATQSGFQRPATGKRKAGRRRQHKSHVLRSPLRRAQLARLQDRAESNERILREEMAILKAELAATQGESTQVRRAAAGCCMRVLPEAASEI